jgi:hypothetical protein
VLIDTLQGVEKKVGEMNRRLNAMERQLDLQVALMRTFCRSFEEVEMTLERIENRR